MNFCVATEVLWQLLGGALTDEQTTGIRSHLAGCPACRALLDQLSDNSALLRWAPSCRSLRWPLPDEPDLAPLLQKLRANPPTQPYPASGTPELADTSLSFLKAPAQEGDLGMLGPYRVLAELGRGGMGIVLLAYDQELRRTVALKVLPPDCADDKARARFLREGRAAAGINHDNVVPVYAVASPPDGPSYLVMQYMEGPTLRERIETEGQLDSSEVARIGLQVADGLAAAHRAGLVHRDIKPANIIFDRAQGRAKIMDFGLARGAALPDGITETGTILGTPEYMSPEQVREPDRIDARTDVYSLGVTLYEALTGEVPFRGAPHMILQQILNDDPRPPRRLNDKIPRDLATTCLHCMHKEPARRYASAGALAEDLARFLAGKPIQARPTPAWERAVKWARRRPGIAALLALVVFVTALGFGLVTWQWRQAEAARGGEADKAELLGVNNYFTKIALADRELADQNVGRAEELLDECPERRRGWEWHYLKRLRHVSPIALPLGQRVVMGEGFDLAFSPDSRLLAIPSADNEIRVWDVPTNRVVLILRGHGARVLAVAFSPDGRRLASTSADRTVRVWDLATPDGLPAADAPLVRTPTLPLVGHTDSVIGVTFSPDGSLLASAGNDKLVKVWNAATGELLCDLPGQSIPNPYVSLAFSPDGRRLASGSTSNTVKVWDVPSGGLVYTLSGHAQPILSVAFSPDGRRLVSAGRDRKVLVWDLASDESSELTPRYVFPNLSVGVWCAALSPDGRRLAVGGPMSDGKVRVYDVATGQLHLPLDGHIRVVSVAFSPDGRRIASAGLDKMVRLWDATTGQEILTLRGHADLVGRVLFSPDGQRLASASADGMVRVWDASPFDESADRRVLTVREDGGVIYGLAFSPDSRQLASAGSDSAVKIRDAETGRELLLRRGHKGPVFSVAFGPDPKGPYRLLSGSNDQTVKLWDPLTDRELFTLDAFTGMVRSVAFGPDGETFATGSIQTLQLWNARDGRPLAPPQPADAEHVECLAFSPDGKHLATAGSDRIVRLWEVAGGKLKLAHACGGHDTKVFSVAFSPDSRLLASGDFEGQVNIWDAATGDKEYTLSQHTDCISGIAFSPDGRYLATASWKEVTIWDAKRLDTPPANLGRLAGTIWCVAFSPDGQHLAAAGGYKRKGEIKIWDKTLWDQRTGP
jgi:eukaryotic-like serine/threonine-protein kinase